MDPNAPLLLFGELDKPDPKPVGEQILCQACNISRDLRVAKYIIKAISLIIVCLRFVKKTRL